MTSQILSFPTMTRRPMIELPNNSGENLWMPYLSADRRQLSQARNLVLALLMISQRVQSWEEVGAHEQRCENFRKRARRNRAQSKGRFYD